MSAAETHKLIELIVNAIDTNVYIDSVVQIGATTSYLITTENTKWIGINRFYTIGADNYKVIDIIPNVSFTIIVEITQSVPTAPDFTIPLPFFYHGTFTFTDSEISLIQFSTDKTPFIYFHEPSNDSYYTSDLDARDKDANCDLYLMQEANFEDWTQEQHYYYAIAAMGNLKRAFIQAAENVKFVGLLDNYGSESHVKFGSYKEGSQTKNIFTDNLSGKKVNITIPFLKTNCDFNAYSTIPTCNEDPVTVENSDESYQVSVDCGDTLILPDEALNIYVNAVLDQTLTYIPLSGEVINITA
jgi:hypothetical protein